ncbi:hypothetical protein RM545_04975 [Zunongwangia sp. F260]|uniref:Uncharacterized protein n=1 Tax=Autumnicola lenta TaxID=3075593 RepID=A0ABU3CI69_9FLAO|nr:hypothetical protein [Zunongwangia sp. F260]MDT0646035.1 hypothetical protein [Zunongwangia sp. F260]
MAPLINRNAIRAAYNTANAKQLQVVLHYEQTILSAYPEVRNQLSTYRNYEQSFEKKSQEVVKTFSWLPFNVVMSACCCVQYFKAEIK